MALKQTSGDTRRRKPLCIAFFTARLRALGFCTRTMRTMGKLMFSVLLGVLFSQLLLCAGKRNAKDWSKVCLWSDIKMLVGSGVISFFGVPVSLDPLGYLLDDAEKAASFFLHLCFSSKPIFKLRC